MGYELHIARADLAPSTTGEALSVTLIVTNTGVAPFYYDWPVELAAVNAQKQIVTTWRTDWKLAKVIPREAAVAWSYTANTASLAPGQYQLLLRVPNPLAKGLPLRFANQTQDRTLPGWLGVGEFNR